MEWVNFVEWAFYGMITAIGTYGVFVLGQLNSSVEQLNVKIAVVISQVDSHDKRISRLEDI